MLASAFRVSNMIFRNFETRNNIFLIGMFKTFVRPILEYASPVWSPYSIESIDSVERVQRKFTKRIPGMSCYPYRERLQRLNLETLEIRRLKYDLVMVYNILHRRLDVDFNYFFRFSTSVSTRSFARNSVKLEGSIARSLIGQNVFHERVVGAWNSLQNDVVTAVTISVFKYKLNKLASAGYLDRFMRGSAYSL